MSTRQRRILFVDDELNVLNGLKRLLKEQEKKWEMSFLDSVKELNTHINDFKPEVLVVDINMPYKNGIEILEEIKSNPKTKSIELIMITGLEDRALKSKALLLGAADLLNKPVQKEDIIARIMSTLRIIAHNDEMKNKTNMLENELYKNQHSEVMKKFSDRRSY